MRSPGALLNLALLASTAAEVSEELAADASAVAPPGHPWKWSRVLPEGTRPASRQGHAAVSVGSRIYVIGGCVQDIECLNDVQIFDTETLGWKQEPLTGDAPEPRGGHSAVLYGTDIYVFGGASSEGTFGDLYKLDLVGRKWSRGRVQGDCETPSHRTNHAAVADKDGRIYLFGGYAADGQILNDLWVLDVYPEGLGGWKDPNMFPVTWTRSLQAHAPAGRIGHSLNVVDKRLFLFGGYLASGRSSGDLHYFDLDAQEWTEPKFDGPQPAARQAHSTVRHGHRLVLAGGCDVAEVHPVCYDDVWSFDTVELRWTKKSADSLTWTAREGHSANFVRGKMFVFGGCQLNAQCYNDVAVLDTFDPCAGGCGGHGECSEGLFCRCSAGWTAHDCMQPLVCPMGCSDHGACSQSGHCVCENGWMGVDCSVELPCPGSPRKCLGRGTCLASGVCECAEGYSGPDCSEGAPRCPGFPQPCSGRGSCSALAQCSCAPGWTGEACERQLLGQPALALTQNSNLALVREASHPVGPSGPDLNSFHADAADGHTQAAVHRGLRVEHGARTKVEAEGYTPNWGQVGGHGAPKELPDLEDMGIYEINEEGHAGVPILEEECKLNCNSRGVCEEGVCFCQPDYWGDDCSFKKTKKGSKLGASVTLVLAAICGGAAFLLMMCLLNLALNEQKAKEAANAYDA